TVVRNQQLSRKTRDRETCRWPGAQAPGRTCDCWILEPPGSGQREREARESGMEGAAMVSMARGHARVTLAGRRHLDRAHLWAHLGTRSCILPRSNATDAGNGGQVPKHSINNRPMHWQANKDSHTGSRANACTATVHRSTPGQNCHASARRTPGDARKA